MRRTIQHLVFLSWLAPSLWSNPSLIADEPRYLLPPSSASSPTSTQEQPPAPTPSRSTYESLTEPRGSLKIIKDKKEQDKKDQEEKEKAASAKPKPPETPIDTKTTKSSEGPIINFNNVSITEVLKYVSRVTGKNFVYDPQELQFTITMISDSPSSVEEVMAMLIQSLRAHGYSILEEGGSYVIHTNPTVKAVGAIEEEAKGIQGPQIATRVFTLQNLDSDKCAAVIKTMISDGSIVEVAGDSRVVVTDVAENLNRIAQVIKEMDAQSGGLEIGQYVAINTSPATLVSLAERVIGPLAANKPLVLVPHAPSNSVFIVSTPYLIEKSLSIMQTIDLNMARSGLLDTLKFDVEAAERARRQQSIDRAEKENAQAVETISEDELRRRLVEQGMDPNRVERLSLDAARETLRKAQRQSFAESNLPIGTIEATQFLIYRLQYRKSSDVATALKAIATSLTGGGSAGGAPQMGPINPEISQSDLIITLNSLQAVDDNNTIVFTGTPASLQKAKDLINQIDIPVRQVFIEALILDTTLQNSLLFGVEWKGSIQRTNFAAETGFIDPLSGGAGSFNSAFDAVGQTTPAQLTPPPAPGGLSAGTLGRKIKFRGKGFRSTGALVQALQTDNESHVILNPKIVTEHNVPAEVFIGQQTPIKGQSIANSSIGSTQSIVATNYNTQETGVSLKVTPLISSHETVTMIIEQKISSVNAASVQAQANVNAPPATVNETRTVTRVHLPSDHFLVMSGLISEDTELAASRIPCLGGLPLVGSLFGKKLQNNNKRNLMIFIRPIIIDTENDIDEITKRQEEVLKAKSTVQEEGINKQMDNLKTLLNMNNTIFPQ